MIRNYNRLQIFYATIFVTLFMTASAYAYAKEESSPELSIVSQPVAISIVQEKQSVTLSFVAEKGKEKISYQWYQTTDTTVENGSIIKGASSSIYTTDVFKNKEIRYYYCVATVDKEHVTSEVVVVAYTGLPLLNINTEVPITAITKDEYVFGTMELAYENGDLFTYEFKKEKDGEKKEGIKGRGNSSWKMPKKGYSIKFDKKQSLFNLPASKKWCIISNYSDKTLLRNTFASLLGNEVFNSDWNPHFVSVDVVWNGEYLGNYIFCERNVIGSGRIDVQDISDYNMANIETGKFTDQNGDDVIDLYDGGFVIELDRRKDAAFWFETVTKTIPVSLKDPDEVSEEIQNHVKSVVIAAEDALYSNDFTNEENGWRKYFNESSVIDWYLINEIARNRDAAGYSSIYKYYSPVDGQLHYGPVWDVDIGFGNDGDNGAKPEEGIPTGWHIKNGFWTSRMFRDSAFVARIINRWNEKKIELDEFASTELQLLADANSLSAECNFLKWKILGQYTWPNPSGFENRQTYQSEVDYMKNWLKERIEWLDVAWKNSFFISYDLNGGFMENPNLAVFISRSTPVFTLTNPEKKGYIFAGWSGTGIQGMSSKVKISDDKKGNKKFIANWFRDIAACDIVLSKKEFIYDGSAFTPIVSVKDGKKKLDKDVDYTVEYSDNIEVGKATITVAGIGEYAGEKELSFTINPESELTYRADQRFSRKGNFPVEYGLDQWYDIKGCNLGNRPTVKGAYYNRLGR